MTHRVAMISYHTCPLAAQEGKETGGMNIYVLSLAKELAKKGIQVDVFTRAQDVTNPLIVQVTENFRVIHIPAGPMAALPKKEILDFIPEFSQKVIKFADQQHISYDVIHNHYYQSGLVGDELRKLWPAIPQVITFHTLALMKNLVARTEAEKESTFRIQTEMELIKIADTVISPSESEREYLKYLYDAAAEKIEVVQPGVDRTLFHPIDKVEAKRLIGADPKHRLLMFVGRIEPLKGIDMIMYALKILSKRNPQAEVCLWIVGGDTSDRLDNWSAELKKLEKLRSVLNLETAVKFVGQKNQDDLAYYYNAAELVVMPSHYESFGMSALEAMACGTPVVTTNVSGISDLMDEEHSHLLTSVNNPLLLSEQIEDLLMKPELLKKYSQKMSREVSHLSWADTAQKMMKIYFQKSKRKSLSL
jgi:D-inositol-3-phosphate glycosyltransferase